MSSIKQKLIGQFAKPRGIAGQLLGRLMAFSNKPLCDWMFEKMDLSESDYVLEVGYGPGVMLEKVAANLDTGKIFGVDHSQAMYPMVEKRMKKYKDTHKVILRYGATEKTSFPTQYFDCVAGINVHLSWDQPVKEFSRLRSFLKPGGRIIIIFQPRWVKSLPELSLLARECRQQVSLAGFSQVTVEMRPMRPVAAIAVMGYC